MVIVNLYARGGMARTRWPIIKQLLKDSGLPFDCSFTESAGHATGLARDAVEKGYELVIAVGGDGTVNEVVNGLVDENGRGRATLGFISAGTVSDFAQSVGIPQNYVKASRIFSDFGEFTIDLGAMECTGDGRKMRRLFGNTAGLGFVTDIVGGVNQRLKILGGTAAYAIWLMPIITNYSNKDIILSIDGQRYEERDFAILVNNGRYLGGGKVFPHADPGDGLLDVAILGDLSKPEAIWHLPWLYIGIHAKHPKIRMSQAKIIEVDSPQRLPVQIDGEVIGETPVSFRVVPAALNVAVQQRRRVLWRR